MSDAERHAAKLRILTFNHHESFLCSLAATGHAIDLVVRRGRADLSWKEYARPAPGNIRKVAFDAEVRNKLRAGAYDLVVCHTVRDLLWTFGFRRARFVFCAHIPLWRATFKDRCKSLLKKLVLEASLRTRQLTFVAVSEMKLKSWGIHGRVVELTAEDTTSVREPPRAGAVVVCNRLKHRHAELGGDLIAAVQRRFPLVVVGQENGSLNGEQPQTYAEYLELVSRFEIYFYPIRQPWGDGFNTALLEAMWRGLAIVSTPNPSSPLVHGESGLIGETVDELVSHLHLLQRDRGYARKLGEGARSVFLRRFASERFVRDWNTVFHEAARR